MKFNDLVRFMQQENFNQTCPVCNDSNWAINYDEVKNREGFFTSHTIQTANINIETKALEPRSGGTPCVCVECRVCGYMRIHSLGPIIKWLNKESSEEKAGAPRDAS